MTYIFYRWIGYVDMKTQIWHFDFQVVIGGLGPYWMD